MKEIKNKAAQQLAKTKWNNPKYSNPEYRKKQAEVMNSGRLKPKKVIHKKPLAQDTKTE